MIKLLNFILIACLIVAVVGPAAKEEVVVYATTISSLQNQIKDTQNQIKDTQNKIDGINDKIDTLADAQALVDEMIDDLNSEIINTMASIGMKEEEIAAKEVELADKQDQIEETQKEYEAAKAREEKQYDDMVTRIRRMYENGTNTYMDLFFAGNGLSDILNRMDFVERIYEYDRIKLGQYEETKNQVHDLWDLLETEKASLETEKVQLEADRADLEIQKAGLDTMLAKKKQESSNYEAEINKAKQEAAVAKTLLQQEKALLAQQQAQLAQQQTQQGQGSAAHGNYTTTSYTSTIEDASGSETGKKVAKYACQFIGNPYVYGGTSLTNGTDCSGFVMSVYANFGVSLPHSSSAQRSKGYNKGNRFRKISCRRRNTNRRQCKN